MYYNQFCVDFLWTMTEMIYRRTNVQFDGYAYSVAIFLLVNLGVPKEQVDEANQLLIKGFSNKNLGEYGDVVLRLTKAFKDDNYNQCNIISSLATVSFLQLGQLSEEQRDFMQGFQVLFDMKPSDYHKTLTKGVETGLTLNKLVERFIELRVPLNSY